MSKKWIEAAMAVFREACELPANERNSFLDRACKGDADIRRHVEAMLERDDDTDPAFAKATEVLPVRNALADMVRHAESGHGADAAILPTIDGYRIVRLIAQGGMGTVYEGEQEHPSRRVAIKIARTDGTTAERAQRFELEAQLLARLRHPRIAQIIEAGTTSLEQGSRPFFVMEFVEGQTLTDYAEAQLQTAREKLELMAAICDALGFAHARGVIHRDLKPDNVLIEAGGAPKVLDFGVAKVEEAGGFGASTMLTEVGRVIGTMGYMSPEQLSGMSDGLGPEADVYSLGVMIYELLTGRRPHELSAITLTQALAIVTGTDAPLLGVVRPEFRGDIEAIVAKALEKDPRHRYADAAALQQDLERHLRGEPVVARPAGPLRRLGKWSRRNPALSTAVFGAFVLLATGLVITTIMLKQVDDARAATQVMLKQVNDAHAATQNSLAAAYLGEAERAKSAHDFGVAAVFAAAAIENNPDNPDNAFYRPPRGSEQETAANARMAKMSSVQFDAIAGRQFKFREDLRLPAGHSMGNWVHNLDFHPEDKRLAALVRKRDVWSIAVWSLDPDEPPHTLPAGDQPDVDLFGQVHWSPDGKRLAAVRKDGIHIWQTTAGYAPEPALECPGAQCVAFHRESRHLALANDEGEVQLWSMPAPPQAGELVAKWSVAGQIQSIRFSPTGDQLAVAASDFIQLFDVDMDFDVDKEQDRPRSHPKQWTLGVNKPGALAFSTDGTLFATAIWENRLQLWSGIDGRQMGELRTEVRVSSLAFLDESHLIYSGHEGRGALIEAREPAQPSDSKFKRELLVVDTMHFPGTQHCSVAVAQTETPEGSSEITIATQSTGAPRLHDLRDSILKNRVGMLSGTFIPAWSNNNRQLVDAKTNWTLIHYDEIPTDWDLKRALRRDVPFKPGMLGRPPWNQAGDRFMGAMISPDDHWLIVATVSRGVVLFALPSLDNPRVLLDPQRSPNISYPSAAAAFGPKSTVIFLGKMDGTILRWSLAEPNSAPEPVHGGYGRAVLSLMVSPNMRWLAAGYESGHVRLFDLENSNRPIELRKHGKKPHGSLVLGVDFSPDSLELVAAGQSSPNHILRWNVLSQELIGSLKGHDAWPQMVRYSPDNKRIFSSGIDSTARIWDRKTGRPLHVFRSYGGPSKVEADDWFCSTDNRRIIRRQIKASGRSDGAMESREEAEAAIGMKLQGLQLVATPGSSPK